MPVRWLHELVFIGWTFAVPAIAMGLALNAIPLLAAGAWTLFAAVVLSAVGHARVLGSAAGIPAPRVPRFRQLLRKRRQAPLKTSD